MSYFSSSLDNILILLIEVNLIRSEFYILPQANASESPVDVYSHMFDTSIGLSVAALYCEWAKFLELRGDLKGADAIYEEGLRRNAQPRMTLMQMHQ